MYDDNPVHVLGGNHDRISALLWHSLFMTATTVAPVRNHVRIWILSPWAPKKTHTDKKVSHQTPASLIYTLSPFCSGYPSRCWSPPHLLNSFEWSTETLYCITRGRGCHSFFFLKYVACIRAMDCVNCVREESRNLCSKNSSSSCRSSDCSFESPYKRTITRVYLGDNAYPWKVCCIDMKC